MEDQPKPRFIQKHDIIFFCIVTAFTFLFLYMLRSHETSMMHILLIALVAGLGQTLVFKLISRGRTLRK